MEDVYNLLNRYLRGSNRFGTNEGIARFLLTHLNEIPSMRLVDVAGIVLVMVQPFNEDE